MPKHPKSNQGHGHVREHSVRIQRLANTNLTDTTSVDHESLSVSGKLPGNHHNPKSTGGNSSPLESIKKTAVSTTNDTQPSEILHVLGTPNSTAGGDQQAGEFKLKDIQLDLNNLVKVDEKLVNLTDALKKNNIGVISQLCSDWWELTDEDDYAVAKF